MKYLDFSSLQGALTTLWGIALVTLIGVGIRVLMMQTIQQRRERVNRQINERLKTLIAAYKTLGGSFTGELTVDPTHLRDLHTEAQIENDALDDRLPSKHSDRSRRIRDAVEAALSDVILLGTKDHVRLASQAASDMVAGRPIHTADLVVSLRDFIRTALDLEPIPSDGSVPLQGPTRTQSSNARGKGDGDNSGNRGGGREGGVGMSGAGGAGLGMGVGLGISQDGNDRVG